MDENVAKDLIELVNGLEKLPKSKTVKYPLYKDGKKVGETNFDYVPLDDILVHIKNNSNFALLQPLGNIDGVSTVKNILVHKSGEMIESGEFILQINSQKMQDVGAVITYSRRYSLGAFLGIATETDNDANFDSPVVAKKATEKQIALLKSVMDKDRIVKMCEHYEVKNIEDLSIEQASETIQKLKKGKS